MDRLERPELPLLVTDAEAQPATDDETHLFVRMSMRRRLRPGWCLHADEHELIAGERPQGEWAERHDGKRTRIDRLAHHRPREQFLSFTGPALRSARGVGARLRPCC
jgi:hypothetical protein